MCPVGWVLDECGSFNQRTCEDYLTNTHRHTTIEVCGMPACVCPEGLVVHKGQCVDPLECHTLIHRMLSIALRYNVCLYLVQFYKMEWWDLRKQFTLYLKIFLVAWWRYVLLSILLIVLIAQYSFHSFFKQIYQIKVIMISVIR